MKRANTMSTITVELIIKMKTKFTSFNAENTNGFISPQMSNFHTIDVKWPSHRHMGIFQESVTIFLLIVPNIGTSIVALRLTCARLHFHVSGAKRPLPASSSSDWNCGWSVAGSTFSFMTNFSPCSG